VSQLSQEKQRKLALRGGRYLAIATQLPFVVLAGYGLGYALDRYFGTTWLTLVCLLAAIVGSFTQLIQQILRDQKADREAKQKK
jgi:F0F1-type ATP synthase assembly protein I